jgi:hypothetical protein
MSPHRSYAGNIDDFDEGAVYPVSPKEQLLAWQFPVNFHHTSATTAAGGRR